MLYDYSPPTSMPIPDPSPIPGAEKLAETGLSFPVIPVAFFAIMLILVGFVIVLEVRYSREAKGKDM